ncbi:MAG TPA: FtsL-like putative cell division protein [Bacteroidales bacterium]|nr:FtsL-like putative cell division protein [Bacteroidales bacterium]HPT02747.1 FtsL-like putative cell division protein [Bacteroidales bacterium]
MDEPKNQLNIPSKEEDPKPEKKAKRKFSLKVKNILDGNFLTRERVIGLLPYLGFVTMLGVVLIFNTNYADKTIIEIGKTKRMNEELRYEYIVTKSKLMQLSRQSQLVKTIASTGLKESTVPPRKILIEKAEE